MLAEDEKVPGKTLPQRLTRAYSIIIIVALLHHWYNTKYNINVYIVTTNINIGIHTLCSCYVDSLSSYSIMLHSISIQPFVHRGVSAANDRPNPRGSGMVFCSVI